MGRRQKLETRERISKTLGGSGKILNPEQKCSYCGGFTNNPKYCSIKCSQLGRLPKEYHKKNDRIRKAILWEEQHFKCNKCDYNKYDAETGPYEIHHLDGNRFNKSRKNEEIVCCNCHAMTDNYRFRGRTHTKKARKAISKKLKKK